MALLLAPMLLSIQNQNAVASGPTSGTAVAWSNDTYFNSYTSASGVLNSDRLDTNNLVWQLYYANAPLTIPADSVLRLGINTHTSGNNSWTWRIAISSVNDTIGNFGTDSQFATGSASYFAGGFNQNVVTTGVVIPANRYFLIGVTGGPYYRSFKALDANRSAQIGGLNYVTSINTIYYGAHGSGPTSGIPSALGGNESGFTTYAGYVPVISIKFKATGTPPSPSLTTPDTPTVTNIGETATTISANSVVANAQSYIASLYGSDGVSLLETRTVTTSQVVAGYLWNNLSANTSYQVSFTAVGDVTNFSNSPMSPKKSFTTSKVQSSISLGFSSSSVIFNVATTITATLIGSTSGKSTFFARGKRIAGCINKTVTTSTVTCNWKPATRGTTYISAIFTPLSSSVLGSSTTGSIFVGNRISKR